jgi:hypothetical protein
MIDKMQVVMLDFKNWWSMPNVVGVIHGIHICITKPTSNFSKHYYYHKTKGYNIVAQVVVDNQKRFMDVFVGLLGSVNDSHVLRKSRLYQCALHGGLHICLETRIINYLPVSWPCIKKGNTIHFWNYCTITSTKGEVNCWKICLWYNETNF